MADVPGDAIDGGLVLDGDGGRRFSNKAGAEVQLGALPSASVTYVMFGHDLQCADGVPPSMWNSPNAPDPLGALAPPFPCGGPWESIWVGQVIEG